MQWLRLYHDTTNDPKWRLVAVRSGQPVGNVLAVWMQMLICASEAEERGILEGWDDELVGAMLGYAPAVVTAIRASMQGLVLDGWTLTGWANRQRQDSDDAAERKRRSRANKQQKAPPPDAGGDHGPNGMDHDVTGQSRDNENLSRDNGQMSRDSHVTASRANQTTDYRKEEGGGGACARAHEIALLVGGLTGLPATDRNVATVEEWLTAGYHPQQDIYPAVVEALPTAKEAPGTFAYFSKAIGRHHARRTAPPDNVSYLPRASGGGRGKAMSGAASDLVKAYNGGIIEIGGVP